MSGGKGETQPCVNREAAVTQEEDGGGEYCINSCLFVNSQSAKTCLSDVGLPVVPGKA